MPTLFGEGGIFGGAERYAFELARHMADVTATRLVAFGDAPGRRVVGPLDVRVLGRAWRIRGQHGNPFHPALARHLLWADVIHCHQRSILVSSFAASFGRAFGRKVFVSDLGGGGWDLSAYFNTDRWFHGHLHISEYSRTLAGHARWDRARVIYGGVDSARFAPDDSIPKEPRVVCVGRLMAHKGIDDLIEALPAGLSLEVIGRPYDDRYFADLRRLSAGKPVVFRPDCDDEEVILAYRRACCVVLPSVYRTLYGDETRVPELLGQTLLEAMACGVPAICTDVASMPEVVVDGQTGFVVPPNDPDRLRERLEWIRDHPSEAALLGSAGRRRVLERFSWMGVVSSCMDAYGRSGGSTR